MSASISTLHGQLRDVVLAREDCVQQRFLVGMEVTDLTTEGTVGLLVGLDLLVVLILEDLHPLSLLLAVLLGLRSNEAVQFVLELLAELVLQTLLRQLALLNGGRKPIHLLLPLILELREGLPGIGKLVGEGCGHLGEAIAVALDFGQLHVQTCGLCLSTVQVAPGLSEVRLAALETVGDSSKLALRFLDGSVESDVFVG